uniref:Uncharacterized protein n=1 Tax=Chromera velia CCMP2878 TaxID=1169474 RepID=A0A0G4FPW2_9ALVE|eukprot:Cvel_18053.t1-p1 / transcript=Cvel_18053.t1 / gene=Cvel_18053 / organism=Chromera_velia_CCMP2878 / gene_product=Myosin-3, putative / transcript_product=Myosin-3, putative / location=Cvel_scaffold1474:42270-45603(-) / protein_length=788 / sequence_SO=supercontig / SO=protein_coding / is_pseudo=false
MESDVPSQLVPSTSRSATSILRRKHEQYLQQREIPELLGLVNELKERADAFGLPLPTPLPEVIANVMKFENNLGSLTFEQYRRINVREFYREYHSLKQSVEDDIFILEECALPTTHESHTPTANSAEASQEQSSFGLEGLQGDSEETHTGTQTDEPLSLSTDAVTAPTAAFPLPAHDPIALPDSSLQQREEEAESSSDDWFEGCPGDYWANFKEDGEVVTVTDWSSLPPQEGGWTYKSNPLWEPEKEPKNPDRETGLYNRLAEMRRDFEDKMRELEEQLELERERAEVLCEDRERWKKECEVLYAERDLLRAERDSHRRWKRGSRDTPIIASFPLFSMTENSTFQLHEELESPNTVAATQNDFQNEINGTFSHSPRSPDHSDTEEGGREMPISSREFQKNTENLDACRQVHLDSPPSPPRGDGCGGESSSQTEEAIPKAALNEAHQVSGDEGRKGVQAGFQESKISEYQYFQQEEIRSGVSSDRLTEMRRDFEHKMREVEEQLELERERAEVLCEDRERWKKEKEAAGSLCESLYAEQEILKTEKEQGLATLRKEKEEAETAVDKERQEKEELQTRLSVAEKKNAEYASAEHRLLQSRDCLESKLTEMQEAALCTAKEKESEICRLQQKEAETANSPAEMNRDLEKARDLLQHEREKAETFCQKWKQFKAQREEVEATLREAKAKVEKEMQDREQQILRAFTENRELRRQLQNFSHQALQTGAQLASLRKNLAERDRHLEEKTGLVSALRELLEHQAQLFEDQTVELKMYRKRFEELRGGGRGNIGRG